ncbi:MAG: hypothetical protein KFF72_06700 [Arthrospira sp. SH-MAG29]|nr:hypothetical protein [Arthrospira sp. SH-MAG29]MBS0016041.1 hypothetical protein [Arthrospira sp. SH-MAG29]
MRVFIQSDCITLSDFLQLPETQPVREYINGKIPPKLYFGSAIAYRF